MNHLHQNSVASEKLTAKFIGKYLVKFLLAVEYDLKLLKLPFPYLESSCSVKMNLEFISGDSN